MPRSRSKNIFSCKCISLTDWCSHFKLPRSMAHMMWGVLGILCNHDPKVKVNVKSGYLRWCTINCILVLFIFELLPFCQFGHRKLGISKTITAKSFKLGHLLEDNSHITLWKFKKKIYFIFSSYCPLHFLSYCPLQIWTSKKLVKRISQKV